MKSPFHIVATTGLAALLFFFGGHLRSSAQQLDPAFAPTQLTAPIMSDNAVEQPDGHLIVSVIGRPLYNGQPVPHIVRLNVDGTRDATFGTHTLSIGGAMNSMRMFPNGQVLLVGPSIGITESLGGFDLISQNSVLVLQPNGDLNRNYYFNSNGSALTGEVQPDGKAVIGGNFTVYNGAATGRMVRLLANGQRDLSFASSGFNGPVKTIRILADGRMLVSGDFTAFGTSPAIHLARLLANGSLDPTFDAHLTATDMFHTFGVQSDGKIIYTNVSNASGSLVGRVHRLLPDGGIDNSFTTSSLGFLAYGQTGDHVITVQPNGGILVAGGFSQFNGQPAPGLVRLLPSGARDPAVTLANDFTGVLNAICTLQDGSALVCGSFTSFNNRPTGLFRLLATGQMDPGFSLRIGTEGQVLTSLRLSNGQILIGGNFSNINGVGVTNLALLNADGTVDQAYTQRLPSLNGGVAALTQGPQNTVYVGGSFYEVANPAHRLLLRLSANGTQDSSFPVLALTGGVSVLASYPDGRLLVGGSFNGLQPVLFRLTAQSTIDPGFVAGFGTYVPYTSALVLQRNEQLAVLTSTTSWQMSASGTTTGRSNNVPRYLHALAVQPDGRILIGGEFASLAGAARNSIARLLPTGEIDPSFDAGNIFMQNNIARVTALAVQDDGRILCAGFFTSINGQPRQSLARLLANGQFDNTFANTAPVAPEVTFLAIHPGGRLLVGASALTPQTNQFLTQGLTCLLVPGLLGAGPAGPLATAAPAGKPDVSVYPSVVADDFTVLAAQSAVPLRVTIYDMVGRVVQENGATGNLLHVSVRQLAAANYVVCIATAQGSVYRRITVRR